MRSITQDIRERRGGGGVRYGRMEEYLGLNQAGWLSGIYYSIPKCKCIGTA